MKLKQSLFAASAFFLASSAPALSCDRAIQVAIPEWMMAVGDFASIREAGDATANQTGQDCLDFIPAVSTSQEALAGVQAGMFEAALVPATVLAASQPQFIPVISGYRFTDAHAVQDAFEATLADGDDDASITVLGMATGMPAFPVFRLEAHQDGPDFASTFEIVSHLDRAMQTSAEAVLSTPARFVTYAFLANPDALNSLGDENRDRLNDQIKQIGIETADRSDAQSTQFLNRARALGMQSFNLKDTDREALLRGIRQMFSSQPNLDVSWILQCTAESCPCAGTNLCASSCCASQ